MSNDSSKHCTLIDKFGEICDKNKDYKAVFMMLSKLCLLSMLTNRVTFLIPVGKALKEMSKLSAAQQLDQFKRHIVGGAFDKAELEGKDRVYTKMIIDKSKRIAYTVAGKGASLSIGGIKLGKQVVKVEGTTRAGKKIPIGVAYEIEELLPIPGEEVPLKPHFKPKKGGGPTMQVLVDYDTDALLDLSGNDLRWAIVEQYRKAWPLTVFGVDSEYSWHQWALASLVSFLKERIPDFYWVYSPYLGMDSFASLDLLFEYYVQYNYHKYILPDELIYDWVRSDWFMQSDPVLLKNCSMYLAGGGATTGGDGYSTLLSSIITLNPELASRYVVAGKKAIGEFLRYNHPEKIREGIVKVYKKVYSEPNALLGETKTIYKQVDSQPYIVALQNDLRRFMCSRFRNHSEFDMLYPSFLQHPDCNAGGFWNFFGGNGDKSGPKWFLKSVMQYDVESLKIDLDGSDKFRFPLKFWEDFVNSPFYLWMSIHDQPGYQANKVPTPPMPKVSNYVPAGLSVPSAVGFEYSISEPAGVSETVDLSATAFASPFQMPSHMASAEAPKRDYSMLAMSMANNINAGNNW